MGRESSTVPIQEGRLPRTGDITALSIAGLASEWGCLQRPAGSELSGNKDNQKVVRPLTEQGPPHSAPDNGCQAACGPNTVRTIDFFFFKRSSDFEFL